MTGKWMHLLCLVEQIARKKPLEELELKKRTTTQQSLGDQTPSNTNSG